MQKMPEYSLTFQIPFTVTDEKVLFSPILQ